MNQSFQVFILISILCFSCNQSKEKIYNDNIESAIQLQDKGKLKEALEKIDNALEIDSSGIVALYQKGLTFVLEQKYDSAIFFCNKAIHAKGSDTLYVELNRSNPIEKDRIVQDVEMKLIRYCRGFSFYMSEQYDKALSDFEFCLSEGYNNNGSVFLYAGSINLSKGNQGKACNYFRLALQNGNPEARAYLSKNCK